MTQDNSKGSPGFFSVLLGRGTAELKGETQAGDEKRPFNEGRTTAAAPSTRPSGPSRPNQQPRSSLAMESRPSLSTSRSNGIRDSTAPRPEQAGRRQPAPLLVPPRTDARPAMPSIRSPRSRCSVDVAEATDAKDKSEAGAPNRSPRKVAFNTPTHSLRKGKTGFPRPEEAGSSSDSSYQPPTRRPTPTPTKPKHARNPSKTDFEERNWNSSTATLQDKEDARSRSTTKSRPAKKGSYPSANGSQADGFQAVRVSGPDRVIIVPANAASPTMEAVPQPQGDRPYMPVSSTGSQRRRGPVPNAPMQPPPMTKRSSQDVSRSASRPTDVQRSRSYRDRPGNVRADGETKTTDREASRSQSRPDKVAARTSTSIRPMPPMPELPATTLLSQNMARARAGQRNAISSHSTTQNGLQPQFNERPANGRARAQRA